MSIAMNLSAPPVVHRLIHGFAWTMLGSVAARGGAFVGIVLAGRVLGTEDYGRLGALLNTVGLLGVVAGFGLGLTATTWISRLRTSDPLRAGRLAGALVKAGATTGTALTVVLAATAWWMATAVFRDPALAFPLAVGAALIPFNVVFGIQSGVITGCGNFARLAGANLVAGLTSLPAAWLGAWLHGLPGAAIGMVLAQGLTCWWTSRAVRATLTEAALTYDSSGWWREWRLMLGFSLPAALASIMVIPVNWMSTAWLVRSSGFTELGLYSAGNSWRMLILFIPLQFVTVSLPSMADARERGDRRTFYRTCMLSLAIAGGVAVAVAGVVALAAKPMLAVFGQGFSGGTAALVILAWSAVPMAVNNVLGAALNGAGVPWRNAAATSIYGVIALAALAYVPATALGLAWAQLIACTLTTVVYAFLIAKLSFATRETLP